MEPRPTGDPDVVDRADQHRYQLTVDGQAVGSAFYDLHHGVITFTHTEVDPGHEGQGLGGRLVGAALDDARRRQLTVVARCPYVVAYLRRHPEYDDLVAPER